MMQNIGTTLQAGVPLPFQVKGTVLQVISSGASAGLTIQFLQGGRVAYTVTGVLTGWKLTPFGGFDSITVQSATGDTISAIVTNGDVDVQVLDNFAQISNTSANPVPVSIGGGNVMVTATNVGINNTTANPVPVEIVSEPGAPFAVSGTVNIGNAAGSPVPVSLVSEPGAPIAVTTTQAASVTDAAPVAVAAFNAGAPNQVQVIAAGARRALRVRNAGAGVLYLGGAAVTPTNAAIALNPGDLWSETDAPQIAWYATSDTGATANIQVIA